MKLKSAILQIMPRDVLKAVVNDLEVVDVDRRSRDDMRDHLSKNCHATPDYLLEYLYLPVAEKIDLYMRSLHEIRCFRTEAACSLCSLPVRISHTRCS